MTGTAHLAVTAQRSEADILFTLDGIAEHLAADASHKISPLFGHLWLKDKVADFAQRFRLHRSVTDDNRVPADCTAHLVKHSAKLANGTAWVHCFYVNVAINFVETHTANFGLAGDYFAQLLFRLLARQSH